MEKLITVYRVENSFGAGAYRDYSDATAEMRLMHTFRSGHPGWIRDFEPDTYNHIADSNYLAGFSSMKLVFKWFGGYIPIMYKRTSLRIVKYKVLAENIKYSISGKQIAFLK